MALKKYPPRSVNQLIKNNQANAEVAKVAHINDLVDQVNAAFAAGVPASAPTLTYVATGGNVRDIAALYQITTIPGLNVGSGTRTLQSYYSSYVVYNDNLNTATSLSFPDMTCGRLNVYSEILTSLSFPELIYGYNSIAIDESGNFNITAPNLTSLSFPKLKYVSNLELSNVSSLTSLSFPSLDATSFDDSGVSNINFYVDASSLTSLTFSNNSVVNLEFRDLLLNNSLVIQGGGLGLYFRNAAGIDDYDLNVIAPNMKYGYISLNDCATATSISLSDEYIGVVHSPAIGGAIYIYNCPNITTVSFGNPANVKAVGEQIELGDTALTESTVNYILAFLVQLDGTNGKDLFGQSYVDVYGNTVNYSVNLSGGTSAAPTGQGLTDKATLEARGATVTTN